MGWVRIDDEAPYHPKNVQVGVAGFGLFCAGLCYANRFLTDGFIPVGALSAVFPGERWSRLVKLSEGLVDAGLWEKKDNGWQIHDYLHYQPTKAEVLADRAVRHAAKVAGGLARATTASRIAGRFASRTPADHQQTDQQTVQQSTSPIPSHPIPSRKASPHRPPKGGTLPAGFQEFWQRYPNKVGKDAALRAWIKKGCEGLCNDILSGLMRNMGHITREGGEFIPNPSTWLNQGRWKDEPPTAAPADRANLDAARAFINGEFA